MIITTSWDDGTKYDLRLFELLNKYNLKGTFYISKKSAYNIKQLHKEEIILISKKHEIGSHTINHPNLMELSEHNQKKELSDSKVWIEQIIQKKCESFCPPYGLYNNQIKILTKEAGYKILRTTNILSSSTDKNFFIMDPLFNVYPYPFRKKFTKFKYIFDPFLPLRINFKALRKYNVPIKSFLRWSTIVKSLLENSFNSENLIFHLFGHAHEIEQYKLWEQLEDFFILTSEHNDLQPKTNIEALKYLSNAK